MENNFKYKRIIILGRSGSGKSTLANRIHKKFGYPIYHLDKMLLNSNFEKKDLKTWSSICKEFLLRNIGVVDGNFTSILEERIKWSDLIIFIDISTFTSFYRIFRRAIRINLGIDKRYGNLKNSNIKIKFSYLKFVYLWNKNRRKYILSTINKTKNKKFLIINKPKKLDLDKLLIV